MSSKFSLVKQLSLLSRLWLGVAHMSLSGPQTTVPSKTSEPSLLIPFPKHIDGVLPLLSLSSSICSSSSPDCTQVRQNFISLWGGRAYKRRGLTRISGKGLITLPLLSFYEGMPIGPDARQDVSYSG